MKYSLLVLTCVLSYCAPRAYAVGGHSVGNGGDVISCPGRNNRFFSLDYVLSKNIFDTKMQIPDVENTQISLQHIYQMLTEKMPSLAPSFWVFINNLNNETDRSQPYRWQAAYDLQNLADQQMSSLPAFCDSDFGSTVQILQAVVRVDQSQTTSQPKILFYYDPDLLMQLNSLQHSFLYVHEWLWSISDDVVQNRNINYFLHSSELDQWTPAQVAAQLHQYGL